MANKDYYEIYQKGDYKLLTPEDMEWLDENAKENPASIKSKEKITNQEMEEVMADIDAQDINEVFGTNEGDWQEAVNSEFKDWDWDDPSQKTLEGLYVEKKTDVGANNSNVYVIENKADNEQVTVWGSTVLDSKFEKIPTGVEVRIQYMGMVKNPKSGREYKDFKVFHRPMPMKEV